MKIIEITDEQLKNVAYGKCYLNRLEQKDHDSAINELFEAEQKVLRKIMDGSIKE